MSEVGGHMVDASGDATKVDLLVDCDVHAYARDGMRDVLGFMPRAWRERFEMKGLDLAEDALSYRFANPHEGGALRKDARPPGGGSAGSDPGFLVEHHVDALGIDFALLNNLQVLSMAAVQAQPDESVALCSAFNDYFVTHWLPFDQRFLYGIVIPAQDPVGAAAEIRRLASHDRVAAAYFPLLNMPMGHRYFHPIYDAAQECGLPIVVHPTSADYIYQGAGVNASGWAETYCEMYAGLPTLAWSNLASLIMTGTLDQFPQLKVLFVEFGFSWVAPALWRMDKAWEGCRAEVPWVIRRPSEQVKAQVFLGTQPVDEPGDPGDAETLTEMLGWEMLVYCSDYPHWDGDLAEDVFTGAPDRLRSAVLGLNALRALPGISTPQVRDYADR